VLPLELPKKLEFEALFAVVVGKYRIDDKISIFNLFELRRSDPHVFARDYLRIYLPELRTGFAYNSKRRLAWKELAASHYFRHMPSHVQ
jgi:hypothetical protein